MTEAKWESELAEYVGGLKTAGKSKQYIGDVGRYLPHLAEHSGVDSFKDLTRGHVLAWLGELKENGIGVPSPSGKQGLGNAKLRNVLGQLKTFLRSLNGGQFPACVQNLPRITIKNGSKVKSPGELLTEEEIQTLGDTLKQPWKAAFLVLSATGARPSEVLTLETKDVSEARADEQGIRQDLTFRDTKTGEPRTVWVYGRAREALEEALRLAGGRKYLFANREGGPAREDSYANALKRAAKKAGISTHVYPYLTRHTFITDMKNRGASDDSIMAMTGHASRAMLDNYSHLTQEQKLKEIAPFLSEKGASDAIEREVQRRVETLEKSLMAKVQERLQAEMQAEFEKKMAWVARVERAVADRFADAAPDEAVFGVLLEGEDPEALKAAAEELKKRAKERGLKAEEVD